MANTAKTANGLVHSVLTPEPPSLTGGQKKKSMVEAGVKVGLGTDLLGGLQSDQSLGLRLQNEVDSNRDVLVSATAVNAEILHQVNELGVIATGAKADLLLVEGDPLADLSLLARPEETLQIIMKDGEIVAISKEDVQLASSVNRYLASNALRILALTARKLDDDFDHSTVEDVEKDMIFLGLVGIRDPPRREAYEAIAVCHNAGIRVIMITGDQAYTAQAIAVELEICGDAARVVNRVELDALNPE